MKMTKRQARLTILARAQRASAEGDHSLAEYLFGTVGIDYIPATSVPTTTKG